MTETGVGPVTIVTTDRQNAAANDSRSNWKVPLVDATVPNAAPAEAAPAPPELVQLCIWQEIEPPPIAPTVHTISSFPVRFATERPVPVNVAAPAFASWNVRTETPPTRSGV